MFHAFAVRKERNLATVNNLVHAPQTIIFVYVFPFDEHDDVTVLQCTPANICQTISDERGATSDAVCLHGVAIGGPEEFAENVDVTTVRISEKTSE
jgi:hypothetical protein